MAIHPCKVVNSGVGEVVYETGATGCWSEKGNGSEKDEEKVVYRHCSRGETGDDEVRSHSGKSHSWGSNGGKLNLWKVKCVPEYVLEVGHMEVIASSVWTHDEGATG